MPVGLPSSRSSVRILVGHQRRVVEKSQLLLDGQRGGAEVPRGGTKSARTPAGDLLERVRGAEQQIALDVGRKRRVDLVDPAVKGDFMARGHHAALLLLVKKGRDRGNEERRVDRVAVKEREDPWNPDAAAEFAPAQPADRTAAVPEFVRLVIAVEGKSHGASRAARPGPGPQGSAGPDVVDDGAPRGVRPFPGLLRLDVFTHEMLRSPRRQAPAAACRGLLKTASHGRFLASGR